MLTVAFGALRSSRGRWSALISALVTAVIVWVLAMSVAMPFAITRPDVRASQRLPVDLGGSPIRGSNGALIVEQRATIYRDRLITIVEVAGDDSASPPPGVAALPRLGRSAVSPALSDLLANDSLAARELEDRVPPPEGIIGEVGLRTSGELIAYVRVTPDSTAGRRDAVRVAGWGLRGQILQTGDAVSPFLVLPLIVLVIVPVFGSYRSLIAVGRNQRARRSRVLVELGTSRWRRLVVEGVILSAPVVVGGVFAIVTTGSIAGLFVRLGLQGDFVGQRDLAPTFKTSVVLLVVVMSLAITALHTDETGNAKPGRRSRSRNALFAAGWFVSLGVALAVGLNRERLSLAPELLVASGAVFVVCSLALIEPVTVAVARCFGGLGLVGEIAAARLALGPRRRRTIALPSLVAMLILGMAFGVFRVLDASSEVDGIIWEPRMLPSDLAFVAARGTSVIEAEKAAGASQLIVIPASPTATLGATNGGKRIVGVSCSVIGIVVPSSAGDCAHAYSSRDVGPNQTVVIDGERRAVRQVKAAVPADMLGGTGSLIVPIGDDSLQSIATTDRDSYVTILADTSSAVGTEFLRSALWHTDGLSFSGADSSIGNVVTVHDLKWDDSRYTRRYGRLVGALLALGLLVSLCSAVLAGLAERSESWRSDQALSNLGATARTVRAAGLISLVAPWAGASVVGGLAGGAMGVAYLHYADYSTLRGVFAGFPIAAFVSWGAMWVLLASLATAVAFVLFSQRGDG